MDAVDLLKQDHQEVKKLLREYEDAGGDDEKRRIARQVIADLMVHERIEEDLFYPAYRKAADQQGKELVAESKEEHHVVDLIIDELQEVDVGAEDFDAKFKVLKENVEHHIQEEEEKMFPQARRLLGERLAELGDEMRELKTNLTKQVEPKREMKR